MVEVKEAIRLAKARVHELFADGETGGAGPRDLRLEEVDAEDDGGWLITLSFLPAVPAAVKGESTTVGGNLVTHSWPQTVIGVDSRRSYKEVEVTKDGQVKAIRMRPIVVR